jgi:hypothetical protein
MKYNIFYKKVLIILVLFLFIGSCIVPIIGGISGRDQIMEIKRDLTKLSEKTHRYFW